MEIEISRVPERACLYSQCSSIVVEGSDAAGILIRSNEKTAAPTIFLYSRSLNHYLALLFLAKLLKSQGWVFDPSPLFLVYPVILFLPHFDRSVNWRLYRRQWTGTNLFNLRSIWTERKIDFYRRRNYLFFYSLDSFLSYNLFFSFNLVFFSLEMC